MKRKVKQLKFSDIAKKSEAKQMFAWFIALEKKMIIKKRENNPSFFIESVYLFLYSLSFFKDIVFLGNLNCQSVPCIDHACWILVGVLSPVEVSIPR